MIRDDHNVIPVLLAILLHVGVFAAMFVAFDFSRRVQPVTPLAIEATLMTEAQLPPPPPPQPDPEELRQDRKSVV